MIVFLSVREAPGFLTIVEGLFHVAFQEQLLVLGFPAYSEGWENRQKYSEGWVEGCLWLE